MLMMGNDALDRDLLGQTGSSPEAFAIFYRRHLPWVLRFLHARVADRELAADLTGEVFASALRSRDQFDACYESAEPWLQTIARNLVVDSLRRGRVEDEARRALGIEPLALTEQDLDHVDELIDQARGHMPATSALHELPRDQSDAVRWRILEDENYADIAARLRCSEAVVRQRVSRGLRQIKTTLEESG